MKTTKNELKTRIANLVAIARELHRRGDAVARRQTEEKIREIAPRSVAEKAIKSI